MQLKKNKCDVSVKYQTEFVMWCFWPVCYITNKWNGRMECIVTHVVDVIISQILTVQFCKRVKHKQILNMQIKLASPAPRVHRNTWQTFKQTGVSMVIWHAMAFKWRPISNSWMEIFEKEMWERPPTKTRYDIGHITKGCCCISGKWKSKSLHYIPWIIYSCLRCYVSVLPIMSVDTRHIAKVVSLPLEQSYDRSNAKYVTLKYIGITGGYFRTTRHNKEWTTCIIPGM